MLDEMPPGKDAEVSTGVDAEVITLVNAEDIEFAYQRPISLPRRVAIIWFNFL